MHPQLSRRVPHAITLLLAAVAVALLAFVSQASAAVANPDLQPACGTKVILVLDESQSIANAGAVQDVRDAANAFANGLADTGSELAVIEFGGAAKRVVDYTTVTSGATGTLATTFQPYFNGTATLPADVYKFPTQLGALTNWEAALKAVKVLNAESGAAPLVVFITDGDPTTTGQGGTNIPSAEAVVPAITEADAVKAQGSHILAVGVGSSLTNPDSLHRLTQVSGPDVAETVGAVDLTTTDVLRISDFSTLPTALRTLVNELCKGSVTITKLVDNGQGYAPGGAGWQFNAAVSTAAGSYSWITPSPGAAGPRSASTGADSTVIFQWKPEVSTTSTITLSEAGSPGYQFVSAACQVKSLANPTPKPLPLAANGASFTANLAATDIVTCDVKNKKTVAAVIGAQTTTLAIDKRGPATIKAGQILTYAMKVTNTGAVTAQNVIMRDQIPVSLSLAVKTPGVKLVKGQIEVQVGNLAPGASKTVTVKFRVDRRASGFRTNTATASATNAPTVRDSVRTRIIKIAGRIIVPKVTG